MEVRLYALDASGARIGEVDDYQQLEWRLLLNQAGKWQISGTPEGLRLLGLTGGLAVVRSDGVTLASGVVTGIRRTVYGLEAQGVDDLGQLGRRLALPDPAGPPFTSQDYDVRTGVAETVIKAYVEANAGAAARSERRLPGLTVAADAGRGSTVTGRARFSNLLTLCAELAEAGGLGLRLAGGVFDVFEPRDQSGAVKFSVGLGTLRDYVYTARRPGGNVFYVGGGGTGTGRTIAVWGDSASIAAWGRVERWLDERDTTDSAELEAAAQAALRELNAQTGITLEPEPTPAMRPYDDWWVGDTVSVVVEGETLVYTIREIRLRITPDEVQVTPVAGTLAGGGLDDPLLRLYRGLRESAARVDALERRY